MYHLASSFEKGGFSKMKKTRKVLPIALAMILSFAMSTTVFAAEPARSDTATITQENIPLEPKDENGISPQNTAGWCTSVSGIGSTYKEVAYAPNGFNCNVRLTMTVSNAYRIDVAMYSGGTKVWEEQDAFNGSRDFWCGNNITSIRVRVCNRAGIPSALTYTCGVDVKGS